MTAVIHDSLEHRRVLADGILNNPGERSFADVMNNIRAALFDLDNTLIDGRTALVQVAQLFYDSFPALQRRLSREKVIARLVEWYDFGSAGVHPFEQVVAAWPEVGMSVEEMLNWYYEELCQVIQKDEPSLAFLSDLARHGVPWGIVTNGSAVQRRKVQAAGLADLAPFVIVSSEIGHGKPEPPIFQEAMRWLGGIDAAETLFVGDNIYTDIAGAQSMGMQTAWVHWGRTFPEDLPLPNYQISHVTDLRPILLG